MSYGVLCLTFEEQPNRSSSQKLSYFIFYLQCVRVPIMQHPGQHIFLLKIIAILVASQWLQLAFPYSD